MAMRWKSFAVATAVVVGVLYLGLRQFGGAAPAPAPALPPSALAASGPAAVRSEPPPLAQTAPSSAPVAAAAPAARLRLAGVVSPRSDDTGSDGVALISVNGLAPKAYRVGDAVANDLVLLSAWRRGATLGPVGGPASLALEIAPPADAAGGATTAPTTAAATALPAAGGARPQPASPATREAVPVTDPDHGVDTSNR